MNIYEDAYYGIYPKRPAAKLKGNSVLSLTLRYDLLSIKWELSEKNYLFLKTAYLIPRMP